MDIERLNISADGDIEGEGEDRSGKWTIKGKVNTEEIDKRGMMKVTFDKAYPSYTIYYTGQINLLRSKIEGYWGHKRGENKAKFTLEMQNDALV